MLPSPDRLKDALEQAVPGSAVAVESQALRLQPQHLLPACRWLRAAPECRLDYLANLTAVDYLPAAPGAAQAGPSDPAGGGAGRIDMVYHLYSMASKHGPVALKVSLPRDNPVVASLTALYRGAEYQEREVYDLYGVHFEGHPDLRRILMWEGFVGHPMRKDYVPENQDAG